MAKREKFGLFGAIMAMAGSAVGLGNLWRFPYLLGEYGGAAFLVLYMVFALVIALPIFFAEFIIGRRGGANCRGSYKYLSGPKSLWRHSGLWNVLTCLVIFSFYSVIGGWCIEYFFKACLFDFSSTMSREDLANVFSSFVSSVWPPLFGFAFFVILTSIIVGRGVTRGIERFGKVAMPTLCLVIILIAVYCAFLPGAEQGYVYMFKPDISKITPDVCLAALGQSFFSLSLGCGCIITYASYVQKNQDMVFHSVSTTIIDIVIAIFAGCAIMPAVFAFGVDPASGPSLVYETLPYIFSRMPMGNAVAIVFFGALLFATLTSSVSMAEVGVSFLTEEFKIKRRKAIWIMISIISVVGVLCSLSFGPLSHFKIFGKNLFDFLDTMSSNVMMTLGALLTVLFVGWKMKKEDVYDEFTSGGSIVRNVRIFKVVYFLIRYIAPSAIIVIMLAGLIL